MVDENQFRFDWETLFEAKFQLPSQGNVSCLFSKAYIQDIDLINMALDGTEKDGAENNEPSSETVLDSESGGPVRSVESDEATETQNVVDTDPVDPTHPECAFELATSEFNANCEEPEAEQCNYVSKKKAKSIRAQLKEMTFDDYWELAGSYLVDICNANDFMSGMVDTIRIHKPDVLIKFHHTKNPIRDVARMLPPRESMEDHEYQVAYTGKIKELAEKDFYKDRAYNTTAKCRSFLHKITRFGYVHGFDHMASGEASSAKKRSSEDTASSAEETSERKLPCYDGMELFTDVEYQAYESVYFGNQELPKYDARQNFRKTLEDASEEPTSYEELAADKKDFDFSFKPERDAVLIAKDADKVMKCDKEIMKYWFQRYRLFSKLNDGVLMDREGWFSVTPEHIGAHIADRMVTHAGCVILDAFTGVGGNAIQFALKGAYVIAVDLDPVRLRCALQNARVYGVADYITFICGNFFHVAKSFFGARQAGSDGDDAYYGIDAVFLSPPWGGPSYLQEKVYDLDKQEPNGYEIYRIARKISPNIGYFLPRNTSVKQLISLAGPGGRVEVEHDVLNGKTKTLTAYFGDLVAS